jgi:hypothetical protein
MILANVWYLATHTLPQSSSSHFHPHSSIRIIQMHIVVRRYSTPKVHPRLGAREVIVCVLLAVHLYGDLCWMALLSDFVASCFYPLKPPINMYCDYDDERAIEDGILVSDVCSWDKLASETFSVTVLSRLGPKLHTTSDFLDPRSSFAFNTGHTYSVCPTPGMHCVKHATFSPYVRWSLHFFASSLLSATIKLERAIT